MLIFDTTKFIELIIFVTLILIIYIISIIKSLLRDRKLKNKMSKNKEITDEIIDEFEELLIENNIKIPNKDRKGTEDEACIYGMQYYELEDSILNILNNNY